MSIPGRHVNLRHRQFDFSRTADPAAKADMALVAMIGAVLRQQWPGHFFKCEVSHKQGVVKINLPPLMIEPNWFIIKLGSIEVTLKQVVRAAGEILERYNLPTSHFSADQFRAKADALPAIRKNDEDVPS